MSRMCEIPQHNPASEEIKGILEKYKTVAVVGVSAKTHRDSYQVAKFLKEHGYKMIPVNPKYDALLSEKCYPSLLEVEDSVDIVDIFRRPDAVKKIVQQAIQIGAKVIWMQVGIVNNDAAKEALNAGLEVVMSRCMMVEYSRYLGEGTAASLPPANDRNA